MNDALAALRELVAAYFDSSDEISEVTYQRRLERAWAAARAVLADAPVAVLFFTQEQVANLWLFQLAGVMHPFTCTNRGDGRHEENGTDLGMLVPTVRGWICPFCDYTQNWAHDFMLDGSAIKRQSDVLAVLATNDNGRVGTTQGSVEPQTRTLRSAHPHAGAAKEVDAAGLNPADAGSSPAPGTLTDAELDELVARLDEYHCDTCSSRLVPGTECSCPHGPAIAAISALRSRVEQAERSMATAVRNACIANDQRLAAEARAAEYEQERVRLTKEAEATFDRAQTRVAMLQEALAWLMRTHVKDGAIIDSRYTATINSCLAARQEKPAKETG